MPIWKPYAQTRLIEPLCGGLAVTLGLILQKALLNDINSHLINYFRLVQKGLIIKLPLKNEKELYYEYRIEFNTLIKTKRGNTKKAVELFYYLNRTGYNGLCRFNQKDEFNIPFGSYKNINYVFDFTPYKDIFQQWEFSCIDFEKLQLLSDDFIYTDPPYDVEFTSYSKDGFTWEDQVRLVKWLVKHPGPVIF